MRFKYEVIQTETRKIERSIALMSFYFNFVLITTCVMYRNRFFVISLDG